MPAKKLSESEMLRGNFIPGAALLLFIAYIYFTLALSNGYMLRWIDDMSLWQPGKAEIKSALSYPGGILWYAGEWLTQFFHYPWVGTSLLLLLWTGMAFLTLKTFRLNCRLLALALLAPLALSASIGTLDEAWISIKSPGFAFSPTLGFSLSLGIALIAKGLSGRRLPAALWIIISAAAFPLFGFYALFGSLLAIIGFIASSDKTKAISTAAYTSATIAAIAGFPWLAYYCLPGQTADCDAIWLKGLPALSLDREDLYLWLPFILAALCLLSLAAATAIRPLKPTGRNAAGALSIMIIAMAAGLPLQRKSEQLHATVLMEQRMQSEQWDAVLSIMSRLRQEPSYTMQVIHNLALAKTGHQPSDLSGSAPATGDGRHNERLTMSAFVQVPVYYHLGRYNQSYRWAMEHSVQFGRRAFYLKYMVMAALQNDEPALAKKYNDMLLRTLFHRQWAIEMAQRHEALR